MHQQRCLDLECLCRTGGPAVSAMAEVFLAVLEQVDRLELELHGERIHSDALAAELALKADKSDRGGALLEEHRVRRYRIGTRTR